MSELKDIISKDIIAGMKAKDKPKLNALRYVKKLLIENETSKSPKKEIDVLISHAKKIKESITMYPEGSTQIAEIETEVKILEEYLPKQLSEEEVIKIINDIVSSIADPNMGSVMKELTPKIKGQFDGKKASQLVIQAIKK